MDFKERLTDLGIFRYHDTGFTMTSGQSTHDVQWNQIRALFGYKLDLITTDEICLDVFCEGNISFKVTEETAGWFIFLERLKEQFPVIDENWNIKITQPAFATNLTLIYERENRTFDQASGLYYKEEI